MTAGWDISYEIALEEMSLDLIDDESTFIQVVAWCHPANHYLDHCWPRSVSPYDLSKLQLV